MRPIFNSNRRRFLATSFAFVAAGLAFSGANSATNKRKIASAKPRLGINLAGLADWNTELPFADLMRMSRDWVSIAQDGVWGKGPALELDENGWVKSLQQGCRATRIVSSLPAGQYPKGVYTILYDGEGEITSPQGAIKKQSAGKALLKVDGKIDNIFIDLVKTNPQNYLRNLRVIMPSVDLADSNPWHPNFLQRWQGIACIRFMDWMHTNHSTQTNWAGRPTLQDSTFANKGAPVELMLDLANRLNCDAWFCMPHLADDDYVRQFAQTVKTQLKPHLKVWLEYSNEVWNGGFEQHKYATKQGQKLGFVQPAWHFYAQRSVQIFNIWSAVFSGSEQLVRVLASQAFYAESAKQILSFKNAAKSADVLAIAPYVSLNVAPQAEDGLTESVVANWNGDKVFAHLNSVALPESIATIKNNQSLAEAHGLQLVAYESGQHLVGILGAENNDKLTQLLQQANADARMGDIYAKNLQAWQQFGGDLNCTFDSVGGWSKWGSWGLLQHYSHKPTAKFKAVIEWAISRGQNMRL